MAFLSICAPKALLLTLKHALACKNSLNLICHLVICGRSQFHTPVFTASSLNVTGDVALDVSFTCMYVLMSY